MAAALVEKLVADVEVEFREAETVVDVSKLGFPAVSDELVSDELVSVEAVLVEAVSVEAVSDGAVSVTMMESEACAVGDGSSETAADVVATEVITGAMVVMVVSGWATLVMAAEEATWVSADWLVDAGTSVAWRKPGMKLGVTVAVPSYAGHPGTVFGGALPPPQSTKSQISPVSGTYQRTEAPP